MVYIEVYQLLNLDTSILNNVCRYVNINVDNLIEQIMNITSLLILLMLPVSSVALSSEQAVTKAKQVLRQSLTVNGDEISVLTVNSVTWPDGSLGCPQKGMMYPQMLMSGFKVILEFKNKQYAVHIGASRAVLCIKDNIR